MEDSIRLVRGTAYGDAKSSCAPGFSGVRRSAAAPDLITESNFPIDWSEFSEAIFSADVTTERDFETV